MVGPGNIFGGMLFFVLYAALISVFALYKKGFYNNIETKLSRKGAIIFSVLLLTAILFVANFILFPLLAILTFLYCLIYTIILAVTVKFTKKESMVLFVLIWIIVIKLAIITLYDQKKNKSIKYFVNRSLYKRKNKNV